MTWVAFLFGLGVMANSVSTEPKMKQTGGTMDSADLRKSFVALMVYVSIQVMAGAALAGLAMWLNYGAP